MRISAEEESSGRSELGMVQLRNADGSIMEAQPGSLLYLEREESQRLPVRTCVAASCMFLVGVVLLLTGMSFYLTGRKGADAFTILGAIVTIPGAYAVVQLYGACQRWPGYDFAYLPSYDYV